MLIPGSCDCQRLASIKNKTKKLRRMFGLSETEGKKTCFFMMYLRPRETFRLILIK